MTTDNAIRFLHSESLKCRDRDAGEALCLLLPALLKVLQLEPMEDVEAAAFRFEFKEALHKLPFQDATDRADGRSTFLAQRLQTGTPDAAQSTSDGSGARRGPPAPRETSYKHAPALS